MCLPGVILPSNTTFPCNIVKKDEKMQKSVLTVPAYHFKSFLLPISNIYHPQVNDIVLVKAVNVTGDFIRCQIINNEIETKRGALYCHLLSLSFYNVTKRNKPKIQPNELILVRIIRIKEDFILVSAKEEWLGQIDKLIDKYENIEKLNNENLNNHSVIPNQIKEKKEEQKVKHLFFLSPMAAMNIFMSGLEISDTLVAIGMNGAVLIWGRKPIEAENKLRSVFANK